ncbi:MAG: class II aldolase/adducin family protein [Hyphomicrobiales bacterium]|nr:class II aldolase/adducin family protein [Hyphomicrobiales bacterium]
MIEQIAPRSQRLQGARSVAARLPCNHFTIMLPARRFLINPKGVAFERITASGLLLIDEDGTTISGKGRAPTTGFAIYARIHLAHPYASEVLHLHPPYSTALTAIQGGGSRWCTRTRRASMARSPTTIIFTALPMRPSRTAWRRRYRISAFSFSPITASWWSARPSHGPSTTFYYLERACQVQVLAMQIGRR